MSSLHWKIRPFMVFDPKTYVTCSINFLKSLFPFCFTMIIIIIIFIHGVLAESFDNHL